MTETAKQGARRLAGFMLAKGYKPEALHEYTDENGFPLYFRMRLKHPVTGEKWIRPMKHDGTFYVFGEPEFPAGKPLYRLHQLRLRPNEVVYLVEGEKCVEELEKLGLLATTSGAADSFEAADWSVLVERDVVIWADNDEAGRRYALGVTRKLEVMGCKVQQVATTELGLPVKGDCVDWLAANPNATVADVLALPMMASPEQGEPDGTGLHANELHSAPESATNDAATIVRLAALPPLQISRPIIPRFVTMKIDYEFMMIVYNLKGGDPAVFTE